MATYKDVTLISDKSLKEFSYIDDNLSSNLTTPAVVVCQDITLTNSLGISLMTIIKTEVFSGTISAEVVTLLNDYIENIIKWDILASMQVPLNQKIRNIGVTQSSDTNVTNVGMKDVEYNRNYYEHIVQNYITAMKLYICDNIALYPEYSDNSITNRKTENYFCGINLGMSTGRNKTYKG